MSKTTLTNRNITFPAILLSALMMLLTFTATADAQNRPTEHTVRQGETLYSISREYGVTVAEIREWNQLEDDNLQTGMQLRIAPPSRNATVHTVQEGETLFAISRKYGVTIAEIEQWNDLRTNVLAPGMDLTIYSEGDFPQESGGTTERVEPSEPDEEPRESIVAPGSSRSNTYYTVRSGDYLNRIASEHGMTTQELRELNNLEEDVIRVGQQLIVHQVRSTPVVEEGAEESTPQGRFVTYRVESGENLTRILDRFLMTEEELKGLNPGTDLNSLRNGQRITVLLPPSRNFANPYLESSGFEDLGEVETTRYRDDQAAAPTTSGELYNPSQLTAAHANMALGSIIYVENPSTGRGTYVKVNDRIRNDGIKLSEKAFRQLGFRDGATASVQISQQD